MKITPEMVLLIQLLIENSIKAAFNTVAKMSADEVAAGIAAEEAKKDSLMAELNAH